MTAKQLLRMALTKIRKQFFEMETLNGQADYSANHAFP